MEYPGGTKRANRDYGVRVELDVANISNTSSYNRQYSFRNASFEQFGTKYLSSSFVLADVNSA